MKVLTMNPKNNNKVSVSEFLAFIELLNDYTKQFKQFDNKDYATYYYVKDELCAIHYIEYASGTHSYYIKY